MIYIGVDLHLGFCYMTVLEASGTILQQRRVANNAEELQAVFQPPANRTGKEEEEILVAVEACGFWPAFTEIVEPLVERVALVHPAKVKAIASAKLKNDRVDSATLAQLLRANLLPESWKADPATRTCERFCGCVCRSAQDRTRFKNQLHATLHQHGLRAPVSDLFGKQGRAWLAHDDSEHTSGALSDRHFPADDRSSESRGTASGPATAPSGESGCQRPLPDDHSRSRSVYRPGVEGRDR